MKESIPTTRSFHHGPALKWLYTLLLLFLQLATPVTSVCSVNYDSGCSTSSRTATTTVTFQVIDDTSGSNVDSTYDATVTFHWGPTKTTRSETYDTGEEIVESDEYSYDEEGDYYVGYTVLFGEGSGSGCDGTKFTEYFILTFDDGQRLCTFTEFEGTDVPTMASTDEPITVTASPTKNPTPNPTTTPKDPTEAPVISVKVTPSPTPQPFLDIEAPDLVLPTPSPTKEATNAPSPEDTQVSGSERTEAPTLVNPRPTTPKPVTASPIDSDETSSPVVAPTTTKPILVPILRYQVSSKMILYHSNVLKTSARLKAWEEVTKDTIRKEVLVITGAEDTDDVKVDVEIEEQHLIVEDDSSGRRASQGTTSSSSSPNDSENDETLLRRLVESSTPLEIEFTTTIQFPSESNGWDAEQMVASAFDTQKKQSKYISDLKEYDGGNTYFESVDSIDVEVGGEKVGDTDANGSTGADDGDGGGGSSVVGIVAGVVGGACVLLLGTGFFVYYSRRTRREQKRKELEEATANVLKEVGSNDGSGIVGDKGKPINDDSEVGMEIETKSETMMLNDMPSSYFGTIMGDGDVDDISTLGDPYMGDAVNAVMDTDNTVGESMVSSQQEYHVWNIKKNQGMDAASRMGGSTIFSGSKNMIFGDDTTLEDIYRTNNTSINFTEDASFQRLTVIAPSGKLGIVLDNPNGELPVVYAIKETSALYGKVFVGDLLLSVDGYDCRGMTAPHVSKFLSGRSQNPERTLVLVRGVGVTGNVTVAV